ncbi:MAG: SCO family protein [Desulfobacterales bacterium]|nr:SCO family protein [Desulfobacterales bacterium]
MVIRNRILRSLQLFVILLAIFTDSIAGQSHDPKLMQPVRKTMRREVRIPIQDFTLIDQAARPLAFESLRGKVVIITFSYTTCPDICPLLTAAMHQVQRGLKGVERRQAFFVTVTTDPEIDSPKIMAAYASRYGLDLANWAFLTGDAATLKKVWKNFGVGVKRIARGLVDHTALTALVDRNGTMQVAYDGPSPDPKAILKDVQRLMQGK